ncbi:cytochrome P450 family protein [Rhodococcoides yunnanense]|uniref:Cytochrome P450 n=1 Tax=Rhodococcoides yunnanense TaxID=278209 RepID=A0ABU4BI76_9NOCA|nr:cytochrome P450 [Rhodococcus yunnanensis]MDV6263914.1 cytochrome P450 [Rhodococcus yunnanensis]
MTQETTEGPTTDTTAPLPPEFFTHPIEDRNAVYADIRQQCPVRAINHPEGAEAYIVADYEMALALFGDPRISKSLENSPKWFRDQLYGDSPVQSRNMLIADAPEHSRLRRLVSKSFVPRRMGALRPRIQEIADGLIDQFPESGEFDLMSFARELPVRVIFEYLLIDMNDREELFEWSKVLGGAPYTDEEGSRRLKEVSAKFERYILDLLEARRDNLGEDLVSQLLIAADEDVFTMEEIASTMSLLIIAGQRTTTNLIGNGVHALLTHPDQLEMLRNDPELVIPAVEEFLRYESPSYRGTLRVAKEKMDIGGVEVGKEAFVHLLIAAANRDPKMFEDPDRFDITRTSNKHLTFGHGAHYCPGAPLSRLEGYIVFPTLLRRLPGITLAIPEEETEWIYDNSVSRGLESLPVKYDKVMPAGDVPTVGTEETDSCPVTHRGA